MSRIFFKIAVVLLAWALAPGAGAGAGAWAQETLRAAAVVNDEIVSQLDVDQRLKLTILTTGLEDTPQLRQRMISRVMRHLIDERLQAQEAERLDIEVPEERIEAAIAEIAQQNNMPAEAFRQALESRGIIVESLRQQVRAQLTWQALIARRIMPSAQVSEDEVEEAVTRVRASQGSSLRQISEIFLAVDDPNQDREVQRNAERIFEELRSGAAFGPLARQFSESATAPRNGDVGWVQKGQLAQELDAALEAMKTGQVSRPIRTLAGYHIVWLRNERVISPGRVKLNLKQMLFALAPEAGAAEREAALARARDARTQVTGCQGLDELIDTAGSPGSGDLGQMDLAELPGPIREAVGGLSVGQVSQPLVLPAGVSLLVVCDREDTGVDRQRIRKRLADERLNVQIRRFMRDLRREANVDIRI